MHQRTITVLILIVAGIHLIPIFGFFGADRISTLYQLEIGDRNLQILMRHRAALFGILGVFLAYAAFRPSLQPVAIVMALVSVLTFLYLCFSVGGYNAAIQRVVVADAIALLCLVGASVILLRSSNDGLA